MPSKFALAYSPDVDPLAAPVNGVGINQHWAAWIMDMISALPDLGDYDEQRQRAEALIEYLANNTPLEPPTMTASIGDIKTSLSETPDTGWLLCDGTQYDRADYPALAALIPEGTPNIGGDSSVFFVPNMTGRTIIGAGATANGPALTYDMGVRGGSPTQSLNINDIPAHHHDQAWFVSGANVAAGAGWAFNAAGGGSGATTGDTGNGSAPTHNNMQPYYAFYFHIYAGV